ncbi:M61 family metallopeptidase [Pacificimonas sp. WHA3]|uniref:M61 family metallopeptidase n=1 Tax=Pacificimonas pallii TaxID=2827236 RepID=A0ABS6SCW3_9SPHN|nr:peptidase M61 [Pacificimonas pallii]MBV7256257.1 M61 family metallopeptidase [Pacificimonas pallii]
MKSALLALTAIIAAPVLAQNSLPSEPAYVHAELPAQDLPYPGVMQLNVDATDIRRGIWRVEQVIPVTNAGPMVLRYPEYLPGKHAPRGEINRIAGLKISSNGTAIAWERDPVDVYAFRIDVPEGASRLDISFEFLSPTASNQGRVVAAPAMLNLQWEDVALYPAGYYIRRIRVLPQVKLPADWTGVSAIDGEPRSGTVRYAETDLETLVDSPMFAGAHFRAWDLGSNVDLNVFADRAAYLQADDEHIEVHRNLVDQALKLFGAAHFDRYDFLLALTDEMGGIGLEHSRSSENARQREFFTEWDKSPARRGLLPHELVHSWNGKFRRPADLWTPDYRTPMQDSLLWVYEGQTSYWDNILGVRSKVLPKDVVLGDLATSAAYYSTMKGRDWRPLADTTADPTVNARRPQPWRDYQRSEDYYVEGALIWLEADMLIRTETRGRKSLDDFAYAFFGPGQGNGPGDWGTVTYDFTEIVETLNAVHEYDWRAFLDKRVNQLNDDPARGIELGGYRLVYKDEPNAHEKSNITSGKRHDLSFSIGAIVEKSGKISRVVWDGPLFGQGVTIGNRIMAVNGVKFDSDDLLEAIRQTAGGNPQPIELLLRNGDRYRTVTLDYSGGLRYPHLEKIGSGRAPLDRALQPR